MLTKQATTKASRKEEVKRVGYPAYVTSAGWLGYDDDKVRRLTLEALQQGFSHFKMKVGANVESDLRRGELIRSVIDDPANRPEGRKPPSPSSIQGKNAGPTGNVLMIDANQVWDVPQAIEYVKALAKIRPWFIEEPTAPDEYVVPLPFPPAFALFTSSFFFPLPFITQMILGPQHSRSCSHPARTQTLWHRRCHWRTCT
jgi:L-fuconate dehydratase